MGRSFMPTAVRIILGLSLTSINTSAMLLSCCLLLSHTTRGWPPSVQMWGIFYLICVCFIIQLTEQDFLLGISLPISLSPSLSLSLSLIYRRILKTLMTADCHNTQISYQHAIPPLFTSLIGSRSP